MMGIKRPRRWRVGDPTSCLRPCKKAEGLRSLIQDNEPESASKRNFVLIETILVILETYILYLLRKLKQKK